LNYGEPVNQGQSAREIILSDIFSKAP